MVPLRVLVDVLAAMVKNTEPLPVPSWPLVIVTHGAWLTALHAQVVPANTTTDALPPSAVAVWLVGVIEKVHVGAFCVSV